MESESADNLERSVQAQSRQAVTEADAIVFLFDGKGGLNPLDRSVVDQLRRAAKPIFFAVNKLDSQRREAICTIRTRIEPPARFPPST